MTTDPQTAADAAERNDAAAARVEAWLDGYNPILPKAAVRTLLEERAELLAERARAKAELEQVRDCHDTLHEDNAKLHAFIAELTNTRTPQQWRLVAPNGHCQVLPREAIEGGMPWPDGWTVETRSVRFGPWLDHNAAETAATRPADDTEGTGEGQRTRGAENEPQRAAEGERPLCPARIPTDVATLAGLNPDTLCALPPGHPDPTHDNGHGLSWQGAPFPPGTPGICTCGCRLGGYCPCGVAANHGAAGGDGEAER